MEMQEVQSSNVAAVGSDGEDLMVRFRNGGTYRYKGAGPKLEECIQAESVGRFINSDLRGKFDSERVEAEPDDMPIG